METVRSWLHRILPKDFEPQTVSSSVAIDLDDTLVDSRQSRQLGKPVLRLGAEVLLRELQQRGLSIILYTTASSEWVNLMWRDHPELRVFFDRVYTRENLPRHNLKDIKDPEQRKWLQGFNQGYSGGKDPALVGAFVLMDDYISPDAQERLGFRGIRIPSPTEDPSEGWVVSVLEQLDQHISNSSHN